MPETNLFNHEQLSVQCFVDGKKFPAFAASGYFSFMESFDSLFPIGEICFQESSSILQSHYPLAQGSKIEIQLQDNDAFKRLGFYPFNGTTRSLSSTKFWEHKLSLISEHFFPLGLQSEFRSDFCTAADYVRKLADRFHVPHEVEDTRHRFRWICPGWRVGQMLRHLAQHSVSVQNRSGYVYFIRYDGTLVFKSMDAFFEESNEEQEEKIDFNNMSADVSSVSTRRRYMSTLFFGSNRIDTDFYDLTDEEERTTSYAYDANIKKRGFKVGVSDEFLDAGIRKSLPPAHKDAYDEYPYHDLPMVYRKATAAYESVGQEISIKSNPFGRKLGAVVHVSFPGESSNDQSIPYSGRYLIRSVNTVGSKEFSQKISLVRPGLNMLDREGVK